MEATTVGKIRIAVGMSVIVTVTLGGWLLAGTAGAARTAGQRVAPTVSNSRHGGSPSLSARAKSVTTVLEPVANPAIEAAKFHFEVPKN